LVALSEVMALICTMCRLPDAAVLRGWLLG